MTGTVHRPLELAEARSPTPQALPAMLVPSASLCLGTVAGACWPCRVGTSGEGKLPLSVAGKVWEERQPIIPPTRANRDAFIDAVMRGNLTTYVASHLGRKKLPGMIDGMSFFYRGQEDHSWGVSSSLYRVVAQANSTQSVTEGMLRRAELRVLERMREEGLGYQMTDGELLMVLQHHLIPTRLVDVSATPMAALYFATESLDSCDGRLFVIGLRPQGHGGAHSIRLSNATLPWATAARGDYAESEWTQQVALVNEQPLDPRMRAQDGRFLVGGIRRRYAGMVITIGNNDVPGGEYPGICVLNLFPPRPGARRPVAMRSGGAIWSLRVPSEWKPAIRSRLAEHGMTKDHMYPPYDESRRLGVAAAKALI